MTIKKYIMIEDFSHATMSEVVKISFGDPSFPFYLGEAEDVAIRLAGLESKDIRNCMYTFGWVLEYVDQQYIPDEFLDPTTEFGRLIGNTLITNLKLDEKVRDRLYRAMTENISSAIEYAVGTSRRVPEIEHRIVDNPDLFLWYVGCIAYQHFDTAMFEMIAKHPKTAFEVAHSWGYLWSYPIPKPIVDALLADPLYEPSVRLLQKGIK